MSDRFVSSLQGNVLAPTGADVVLVEWVAEPNHGGPPVPEAPVHLHEEDDESWYVLSGTLGFRIGDDEVEVASGGAVTVPRGTPHTYWNPAPVPARYVLVMTARIYALIRAIHASTDRGPERMRAIFAAHGAQLLE